MIPQRQLTSFVTGDSDFASLTANPKRPTVVQLSAAKPVLTKTAARSQVKRGEVVPYTITATNVGSGPFTIADIMPPGFGYVNGSAIANGSAVVPVINGQTLTFNGLMSICQQDYADPEPHGLDHVERRQVHQQCAAD